MTRVKWRQFRRFSGPLILGKKAPVQKNLNHSGRVALLTSLVESGGRLGTVMAYDGTGMTAGLIQCIAVLPRALDSFGSSGKGIDAQGSLWPLVEKIGEEFPDLTARLNEEFNDALGWEIRGGKVVKLDSGIWVDARDLRNELSPPHGVVPKFGEHWDSAKGWALIFHEIFSDPRTFILQRDEATRHFAGFRTRAWGPLHGETIDSLVYNKIYNCDLVKGRPLDLAIAVFLSFSVNAPRPALEILWETFKDTIDTERFHRDKEIQTLARNLVLGFKKSQYGNWQRRYERTRKEAKKIWPTPLFSGPNAIMP
jgi:hypothetical protein